MDESILNTIKKMIGIPEYDDHFDLDLIIHINSALFTLCQIGIGPSIGYSIQDETDEWEDFLVEPFDSNKYESVKTYVYISVRLVFDPPQSSTAVEALNRRLSELEWRLNVKSDSEIVDSVN